MQIYFYLLQIFSESKLNKVSPSRMYLFKAGCQKGTCRIGANPRALKEAPAKEDEDLVPSITLLPPVDKKEYGQKEKLSKKKMKKLRKKERKHRRKGE